MTTRRSQGLGGGGSSGGSTEAAARTLCVAVVGLSGTEREKGATGVGKSCLCNRFVRPLADDYHTDHISVLSQTDFGGRVVNNDHFLYWGEVNKTSEEGAEYNFHVVEQTEFIDDSSFQPFKSGKTDPYIKRSTTTRLTSAEKLMYICKNQLGIEKEYEQKLFPDGRMSVDGFICVFDVCQVPGRMIEKQVEFTAALLNALLRTRKPVVLATSKGDEAVDAYIREAERLVARKDLKGQVPLVETSAHENINVDNAFLLIAQMADKAARGGRGSVGRIAPFTEAVRARREALDEATEAFQSLVRTQVTDHRVVWSSVSKRLSQSPEFERYCGLFGRSAARTAFDRHVRRLREEHVGRRVRGYLRALPAALADLLPNLESIGESDWTTVKDEILRSHPDFDNYFLEVPGSTTWQEAVDSPDQDSAEDGRIPFPLLELSEAENCFLEHRATLEAEQRRRELRDQFTQLLEETGYVTPGKTLGEVRVLFMGRECYEQLSEADLLEVYEEHQREITERARAQFQELLLEHAELFYEFANVGPGSVITQEDIAKITEALQEDSRYKTLDRLDQDRMLMLLRHLGFVHGPIREHCPANPNCMDNLIEKVIAQKAHRPSSWTRNNQWLLESENNQLNLVVLGTGGLADEVASAVRAHCNDDTFELDKIQYSLDFRIIDGDVGLPQNSFRTTDFTPHGCFCVYSNHQSLEYVRDSLEKTLLSNLEQDDRLPFHGLPIVILFAADASINEKDLVFLREEGQNRAKSLQCPFVDVTTAGGGGGPGQRLDASRLLQAMASLVESIQRRAGLLQIYHSLPEQAACPDLRVLMCMLCGDPYAAEHVLAPLLAHQCCLATGPHSLTLETYLGAEGSKRSVQVRVTSYHEATAYRDHLIHGFILVYSAKRRASLATLSAFSKNIANVPIQIVAVTESGSASAFFSSDLSQQLIRDGNALADVLQAHFMTTSSAAPQKTAIYTPFFKEVWERKPQIEKAFYMEDSDYSPEGRTPVPPPVPNRQESYNLCGGRGSVEDGGDSEGLYEQLPADGQRGGDGDESSSVGGPVPSLSPSDDSELYTSVFSQQENGTEHLVKPSQVKKRRSLQAGWTDNRMYGGGYQNRADEWNEGSGDLYHTYHTERHKVAPPTKPKPSKPKPGKLNLKQFDHLTDAITRLNLGPHKQGSTLPKAGLHAPLATPESTDDYVQDGSVPIYAAERSDYAYAAVRGTLQDGKGHRVRSLARRHASREHFEKAVVGVSGGPPSEGSDPSEEEEEDEEGMVGDPHYRAMHAAQQLQRSKHKHGQKRSFRLKRRKPPSLLPGSVVPVPPRVPLGSGIEHLVRYASADGGLFLPSSKPKLEQSLSCVAATDDGSSYDVAVRDLAAATRLGGMLKNRAESEKSTRKKEERKKAREDEKLEKRRMKEEERQKRLTEKKKKQRNMAAGTKGQPGVEDFVQSEEVATPLFVDKCIRFIEEEGLDSEGIYRVPGNRAHVDLLFQKFDEDPAVSIRELDIPVNAVATALKDFFSKRLPPLLSPAEMDRLTEIAGVQDRSCRLLALRELVKNLPPVNFEILKFVFQHFVKVAENCRLNSMDSKNLAICWWPTLLPLEFNDMGMFERVRPHLEESVQTMIDQFRFLYCNQEEVLKV